VLLTSGVPSHTYVLRFVRVLHATCVRIVYVSRPFACVLYARRVRVTCVVRTRRARVCCMHGCASFACTFDMGVCVLCASRLRFVCASYAPACGLHTYRTRVVYLLCGYCARVACVSFALCMGCACDPHAYCICCARVSRMCCTHSAHVLHSLCESLVCAAHAFACVSYTLSVRVACVFAMNIMRVLCACIVQHVNAFCARVGDPMWCRLLYMCLWASGSTSAHGHTHARTRTQQHAPLTCVSHLLKCNAPLGRWKRRPPRPPAP